MYGIRCALLRVDLALHVYEHGLTRRDVPYQAVIQRIQCGTLRSHHVFHAVPGFPHAVYQRADAVGIAKGDNSAARDHCHDRVSALATPVHAPHGGKYVFRPGTQRLLVRKLVCQHVQQDLGVRLGIQMTAIITKQFFFQLAGIHQVAVMAERNAERRIHVQGLCLG